MGKLALFIMSFGLFGLISSYCHAKDIDSDGDGVSDLLDAFPNNPSETVDSDGDQGEYSELFQGSI